MPHRLTLRSVLCLGFAAATLAPLYGASAEATRPEAILQRVNEQIGALRDYECLVDTDTRAGSKKEARSFRLWYKQPGMLRVRVLRGRSRGSEVVVAGHGSIRGRKGGLLKPIVVRMNADDDRVRNLRGVPVTDFIWSSFYRRYRERAALPGAQMTLLPRRDGDGMFEIQLVYIEQGRPMRELLRVDPGCWFLQEIEVFDGSTCVDRAVFHDWKTNTGLKETWFRL